MKLDTTLTLSHLNLRREKAGDDEGPIAIDLKFTGDVRPEDVSGLFSTDAQYRRILGDRWDGDNDLTITDATKIPLSVEGIGVTIELETEIAGVKLRWPEGNIDGIVLETKPGRLVGIKLRAQVHPTKEQVAQLTDWHSADLKVSLWSRQHDLDLQVPEKAAKPAAREATGEKPLFTAVDEPEVIVPGQKPPQRPKRHGVAAH
jgi:hypothetical protein